MKIPAFFTLVVVALFARSALAGADAEIRAVLDYIGSTWPERERQYQAERTRADQEARQ